MMEEATTPEEAERAISAALHSDMAAIVHRSYRSTGSSYVKAERVADRILNLIADYYTEVVVREAQGG